MNNENAKMVNLTLQEITDYLGIDYSDEQTNRNLTRILSVTNTFLNGAIGEEFPKDDARAKEIALAVIDDLYSNRGTSEKVSVSTRRLIDDFTLQLKLELARRKEM